GTPLDRMKFTHDGRDITPFIPGDVTAWPGTPGTTNTTSGGPEADLAYSSVNTSPDGNAVVTRATFMGLKYDVNDRLAITLEGRTGRSESNVDAIRGAEFRSPWNFSIAVDNAYLPENVRQMMVDHGLNEIRVDKNPLTGQPEPGS